MKEWEYAYVQTWTRQLGLEFQTSTHSKAIIASEVHASCVHHLIKNMTTKT